jgi:hypothetical protein
LWERRSPLQQRAHTERTGATGLEPATSGVTGRESKRTVDDARRRKTSNAARLQGLPRFGAHGCAGRRSAVPAQPGVNLASFPRDDSRVSVATLG